MALIKFLTPYNKITNTDSIHMEVESVREMAHKLRKAFGEKMDIILDGNGDLSTKIVVLINRRNACTLKGADTALDDKTEVIILPYIYGG